MWQDRRGEKGKKQEMERCMIRGPQVEEYVSPWDSWCRKEWGSDGEFFFKGTPDEYVDFHLRIEEDMRKEVRNVTEGPQCGPR